MTNLRCTTDHHALSPLNIRPEESGIIPDHFSTGWKTYPAHHDLSERARPTPAVFLTNIRSPRSRPAHCRSVHFSSAGESWGWSVFWCERDLKLHSHQTADQPPTNADRFLSLGRVWSGKRLPALIEERIYPRSTPAVSLMHPHSNPALPDLHPSFRLTNPRSVRPTPTYSWCNYAHYAIGPTPDLISTPGLNWRIQANVMPTDSVMWVQYTKCAHGPYRLKMVYTS